MDSSTAKHTPIVVHIPHTSMVIPEQIRPTLCLTDDELRHELLVMTDRYTDELFEPPGDVAKAVVFPGGLHRLDGVCRRVRTGVRPGDRRLGNHVGDHSFRLGGRGAVRHRQHHYPGCCPSPGAGRQEAGRSDPRCRAWQSHPRRIRAGAETLHPSSWCGPRLLTKDFKNQAVGRDDGLW